ncbi:MAG: lamin tail domain-containing protein, partial [Dinghuibacter sp.]|nr:lamin tail domain-containing protein [Dinghuibacter sp.]
MKARLFYITVVFLFCSLRGNAQGRVVINEYLPWPLNGCGVTSEFVELLNFGPGPINIGCYILTDGDYSITIPPNTILQPGQFYVISGQDVIIQPCDNVDSTITAHLNWNTCNCTSAPIPTTGDGFLTDGGSAAEQLVLLDPLLNVVDAVVRKLPAEPSSLITTSSVGGGCTPQTFDLDLMNIDYETIGESDGRGNSMARKTDGDCGWVKDSRQSGNATNNTAGEISSLDASFYVTSGTACLPNLGSILIVINSGNMAEIFPLRYILAFDSNNDNVFDFNDTYTT